MAQLIGQDIGRYHIVEQLGEGGMAQVYKAYDHRLERYVAVKVILPSQEQSEMFLKRFEREAKSLAGLSHSNIVRVLDYGEQDGMPYLIMEYISGGTLKQRMGRVYPYDEAAHTLFPIAQALDYAHQHGIYHRDVKPANILINDGGQPLLSDFGIAKVLETGDQNTLTGTGVGIGTPEYMSPEQGLGQGVDGRSDVYSLGVIFYEMITGRKPFRADTPMAVVIKQINDPLPRPREYMPELPEAVEAVVFQALAKKPEERFQSMAAFAAALSRLAQKDLSMPSDATVVAGAGHDATMAAAGATVVAAPGGTVAAATRLAQAGETPKTPSTPVQVAPGAAPAAKKGISPLVWVGAGLAVLVVIGMVVVGLALGLGAKKAGLLGAKTTQTPLAAATSAGSSQVKPTKAGASAPQATQATGEAVAADTAAPASQATPPANVPVISGGQLSLGDITAGLDALSSYKLTFTTQTTSGSSKSTTSLVEEADNTHKIKHLHAEKTDGTGKTNYDFYIENNITYTFNAADGSCQSAGEGQEGLIAAMVPLPAEYIGAIEKAVLVNESEEINGVTVDQYSVDASMLTGGWLSSGKGQVFLAQDGKYVVKFGAQGTGNAGDLVVDYEITAANQPLTIMVPDACKSSSSGKSDIPLPANATNVGTLAGMITFKSPDSPSVVANFFKLALPQKGWTAEFQTTSGGMDVLIFTKDSVSLQIMIQAQNGETNVSINQQQ